MSLSRPFPLVSLSFSPPFHLLQPRQDGRSIVGRRPAPKGEKHKKQGRQEGCQSTPRKGHSPSKSTLFWAFRRFLRVFLL